MEVKVNRGILTFTFIDLHLTVSSTFLSALTSLPNLKLMTWKGPWLDGGPSKLAGDLQTKITGEITKFLSHNKQYLSQKVLKV